MKFDLKSLKIKIWLYFMLFVALILIILWLLQIMFLKSYYQAMKTAEIEKAANVIISQYGKNDFDQVMQQYTFRNNMLVIISDMNGHLVYTTDMFSRGLQGDGQGSGRQMSKDFSLFQQNLLDSETGTIFYKRGNPNMQLYIYGALINKGTDDQLILYISSPLDPIDSTIAILKNQLIIVTGILLLLAFFIAFFISRRLSRPIVKLTDSAKHLAAGDFNVIFERGDYSEIDQLATTLNYATRELSKVDELRKELIANVSHDLRTPLTIIKVYSEMIKDISGDDPEKRNEHADIIINEVDRLSTLVNEILDLSNIQSANEELSCIDFDLSKKAKDIIGCYEVLCTQKGYTFNANIDENIIAHADEARIERVIHNLISNAINYIGDDKKVTINLRDLGNTVRFEVIDTGKGIPKEKLEYIWERYYKAKETHKRAVVGSGLGLSIVKSILELHKANYGVESKVGSGSTFWFEVNKSK
ncbi:MAG TPA: HAMP domain-containing sensor histidine kinase [Clostridia bacterium]|nr:HAMP domain-containing sensor histidine kinase [Clostridia bacterium]